MFRRIRRTHALEHATIAVLLERGALPPLAGNATPWGFFVYGRLSTAEVSSAASEALVRLRSGHSELAVSPYCGTNLVIGALLLGLFTGLLMKRSRRRLHRFPLLVAALVGASVLKRPLGDIVQRHYTTLSDMSGIEIGGINRFEVGRLTVHFVGTGRGVG